MSLLSFTESSKTDELLQNPTGVLIKTTLVDFPKKVASAYFIRGCNLRCPYCYNIDLVNNYTQTSQTNSTKQNNNSRDFHKVELVSPVTLLEHLHKRKNVIEGLVISGGEPLLHPVTPLIIKTAKQMGYKIKLDTNGTLPLILENLFKDELTRPDFVAMDIKTSPENYIKKINPTTNFKNSDIKELIKASLNIIQTLKPENYEIRTVLVPTLIQKEDIKNIATLLPKDASWQFAQFQNKNCLDPTFNQITPYTDTQLKDLVEYAKTLIPNAALR